MKKVVLAVGLIIALSNCTKEEGIKPTSDLASTSSEVSKKQDQVEDIDHKNSNSIQAPDIEIIYDGVFHQCGDIADCVGPPTLCVVIISENVQSVNDNKKIYSGSDGVNFTYYKNGDEHQVKYDSVIVETNLDETISTCGEYDPSEINAHFEFGNKLN
jgi:hypothetical protein